MKESEFSVVPLEVVRDRRLTLEQTRVLACSKCNGKKGAQDYDAFVTQTRKERS